MVRSPVAIALLLLCTAPAVVASKKSLPCRATLAGYSLDHPHVSSCADGLPSVPPKNRIPTLLLGAHVHPGSSNQQITHHNVLRTILDMEGLPAIGGSATASPTTGIWQ